MNIRIYLQTSTSLQCYNYKSSSGVKIPGGEEWVGGRITTDVLAVQLYCWYMRSVYMR